MTNRDLVANAHRLCKEAHKNQLRDNGEPYAIHPIAVASILETGGIDDPVILAAAYLHDVLEDTHVKRDALAVEFGEDVTLLVEELTNLTPPGTTFQQKHTALSKKARQMSDAAKLVKLADRLHNLSDMRTAWPIE